MFIQERFVAQYALRNLKVEQKSLVEIEQLSKIAPAENAVAQFPLPNMELRKTPLRNGPRTNFSALSEFPKSRLRYLDTKFVILEKWRREHLSRDKN